MIYFHTEDISFKFNKKLKVRSWLTKLIEEEKFERGDINIIFCSDAYLLNVNKEYLHHDYYTDIITFNYVEDKIISGDLFISIDSVKINSVEYSTEFETELFRVLAHGVLHLIGYDDHCDDDITMMRQKENYYLSIL